MKAGKIALIAIVAIFVLIGGILVWFNAVVTRNLAEMERDVKALHEEVKRRDMSRPPGPGATLPGNAWDDYQRALDAVDADRPALADLDLFANVFDTVDWAKYRAPVAAHSATLDLLRSGARRKQNLLPVQWEAGYEMKLPNLLAAKKLASLAAARAHFLAEEGKYREGAELVLDVCQFLRDLATTAGLFNANISMVMLLTEFDQLREILVSGALSKGDLSEIERALQELDQCFPRMGHAFVNESLYVGYILLPMTGTGGDLSPLACWRYGFSTRLAIAAAQREYFHLMKRVEQVDDLGWSEARKLLDGLDAEAQSSKNPMITLFLPGLAHSTRYARERRTELRLLLTAARWRSTGQAPDLADPFGDKLLHDEKDGIFRVWSVGPDGLDNAGIGEWKPMPGKDMVLQWKR